MATRWMRVAKEFKAQSDFVSSRWSELLGLRLSSCFRPVSRTGLPRQSAVFRDRALSLSVWSWLLSRRPGAGTAAAVKQNGGRGKASGILFDLPHGWHRTKLMDAADVLQARRQGQAVEA